MITNTQNSDSNMTNFHSKIKSSWENKCWNNIIHSIDQPATPQWHGRPQPGWPRQDQRWRRGGSQKTFTISLLLLRHHHWQGHRKKDWTSLAISIMTSRIPGPHSPSPRWSPHPIGHRCHRSRSASDNMNMICLTKYFSSPYFLQASRNHRHVWYVAIFYFIFAARPQADNPCLPDLTRKSCPITQHHTPSILS